MSEEEIQGSYTIAGIHEIFGYLESREESLNINFIKLLGDIGFSARVLSAKGNNPTVEDFLDFTIEFSLLVKFLYPMMEQLETSVSKNFEIDWQKLWEE